MTSIETPADNEPRRLRVRRLAAAPDASARGRGAARRWSWLSTVLAVLALLTASGCTNVEEKRIRELLVEKGFGTRAQGVAQAENYIAGGDGVQFIIPPTVYLQPGAEQMYLLNQPQSVQLDGTIWVPYIGPVYVLGMTERELTSLVREQLQPLYQFEVDLQARIVSSGKFYYMYGEALNRVNRLAKPDLTFLEAMFFARTTRLANLGRVKLIRPDAENPLVLEINFREMIQTGNTTYNVLIQENDIIYVPPTFFGHLTRLIQKLVEPLNVIVSTAFGIATLEYTYDVLTGDAQLGFGFGRRF